MKLTEEQKARIIKALENDFEEDDLEAVLDWLGVVEE